LNTDDWKSISGYVFTLGSGAISWSSKKATNSRNIFLRGQVYHLRTHDEGGNVAAIPVMSSWMSGDKRN
jgi:hypothetical protein